MARYSAFIPDGTTLSTFAGIAGKANMVLQSIAGMRMSLKEFMFGGEMTATTAMRTKLARDSVLGTGAISGPQTLQKRSPQSPTAQGLASVRTAGGLNYATTEPTIVAGALVGTSWNAHGGVVRWLADPGGEHVIYEAGAATSSMEFRQDVGAGTMSQEAIWEED